MSHAAYKATITLGGRGNIATHNLGMEAIFHFNWLGKENTKEKLKYHLWLPVITATCHGNKCKQIGNTITIAVWELALRKPVDTSS